MSPREPRPATRYHGDSYYGLPPLKSPHWDWKVSGYIALAGIAGAAQALAWIGRLRNPRRFRGTQHNARVLALAGTVAGTALLMVDLKTPQRFYNMLRILRPSSPMSIGTYVLGLFGACSAVAALGELATARRRPVLRRVADVAQAGAAISGAGAATYTAALRSATSTPYWAAAPRAFGVQFATSALAGGAAALALGERAGGRHETAERLEDLAGNWLVRDAIVKTGKASSARPEAAFRLAQTRHLPSAERRRLPDSR